MKVLVLGAGGMLGAAVVQALRGHEVAAAGRAALDVRDPAGVLGLVAASGAEVAINCAAHTDVEGAERDPDAAFAANALLPGLLAQGCRRAGARLVHVSSTGCYGTAKAAGPYTEQDPLQPTTVHHRAKAMGEALVREAGCEHLIVRTGWLFGGAAGGAKNFVWKRLLEARTAERMTSDPWQRGNPTYAVDVARQIVALAELGLGGTVNCVSQGEATRFDYVAEIVAASGLPCRVEPAERPFERLAKVSMNETALNWRLGLLGLDRMPHWREALGGYVRGLMASPEWRL